MGNSNTHLSERSRNRADSMRSKFSDFHIYDTTTWGYTRDQGPETWWVHFPAASGTHQSPINIDTSIAEFDSDLATYPLRICYKDSSRKLVWNTGHGCQVNILDRGSYIRGGPLRNKYLLEQFHFHWGDKDDCGSEHTVNKQPYSAEVHLVHWNCDKYSSFQEASEQPDGLAVLAVFLQVSHSTNQYLKHITDLLESIPHKLMGTNALCHYNPNVLLPTDCSKYWVYRGSLTTPPCHESVTWVILYDSIPVSSYQLAAFRSLRSYAQHERKPLNEHNGRILENYRPVQNLGSRRITTLEHVFTSNKDFDAQFHKQNLFLTSPEMMCQQHREGLPHEHTQCPAKHLCRFYKPL